jgi:tetratricopeptide (TPR) repeat protein
MIRISYIVYRISCLFLALFLYANSANAKTAVESLPQVEILFMQGKYEMVVVEADKLIDSGKRGREELFYLKGLSQIQLNRFKEARETFGYMLERYPRGKRAFDGHIGIGDSYFSEDKCGEAITSYKSALDAYPDHKNAPVAYYKIGASYRKMGLADKAEEYFNKVKNSSPLSFESKTAPKDVSAESKAPLSPSEPAVEAAETGDYYYIQAGYFKTKGNAQKLTAKLRQKGYDSYMSTQISSNLTFYRVKVGRFKSKAEAEGLARRLNADGYKTRVCR